MAKVVGIGKQRFDKILEKSLEETVQAALKQIKEIWYGTVKGRGEKGTYQTLWICFWGKKSFDWGRMNIGKRFFWVVIKNVILLLDEYEIV